MADTDKGEDREERSSKPKAKWPWVLASVITVAFVAIVLEGVYVPTSGVWTDDAYVEVHYASIAPRISGQVIYVGVEDNQTVDAGTTLVKLDPQDQQTAVASAEATLAHDEAQFRDAIATVTRQPSLIDQQSAQVSSLQAQIGLAAANQRRYRDLAATGAGTQQSHQAADAMLAQERAELRGAEAGTQAARHQLDVLEAMAEADRATIDSDQAKLRQARLDLSYTVIAAPMRGTVSERSVQVGDYVAPGTTLMAFVPLNRLYVTANYLETSLTHVLPGQHARIHVDAYKVDLDGVVQSMPPASGSIYSPVPATNATGNFTKIVQRLPVRILVSPGQRLSKLLRAGLSVETTIDTHLANVVEQQAQSEQRVTSR